MFLYPVFPCDEILKASHFRSLDLSTTLAYFTKQLSSQIKQQFIAKNQFYTLYLLGQISFVLKPNVFSLFQLIDLINPAY